MKPVAASTAYLLISHGSRDPRPQQAMNQLAELVRQHLKDLLQRQEDGSNAGELSTGQISSEQTRHDFLSGAHTDNEHAEKTSQIENTRGPLAAKPTRQLARSTSVLSRTKETSQINRPQASQRYKESRSLQPTASIPDENIVVGTACLELSVLPLRQQIYEFGCRLIANGVSELKLLPVFLMAGVHVMEDIPTEIAAARELLGDSIRLTVCDHLGSHPCISDLLEKRLASVPAEKSILVAHGSRRPRGNKGTEQLAKKLNTQVAYWSVPPDIETQVIELMQQGCQRLTIFPYFLFAGGITDAITHRTEELAERFPKVQFRLLPTLGATAEVAQLSVDMIQAA